MTKKEEFKGHISAMNTKSLENVLVNNAFKKFTNTSFIEKLNDFFLQLKAIGNTHLEIHNGIGICACNKDKKTFCFAGNKTKDYFTLSYLEDENNYYNFSTSCSEVLYDNPPQLNKFHYFSIKPESTSEYKKHNDASSPIQEYKVFSSKAICNMGAIDLWLKKYKNLHQNTVSVIEEKANHIRLKSVEILVKKEFEILYGKLNILSILHNKEAYFKEQLKDYNTVKDSKSKLKNWFEYQTENKNKYQLFSAVFYDKRELTYYCLKLDEITLNPEDFKHTLKYLAIIEDSKSVVIEGVIKEINDVEVFEKTKITRASKRRKIVVAVNDFYCSELQVVFTNGRVNHLDNISEGQFVKVFVRLTGGEWENSEGIKEYKQNLFGWRIEKLIAKPKTKNNKEEMDLYYKYILPPPF